MNKRFYFCKIGFLLLIFLLVSLWSPLKGQEIKRNVIFIIAKTNEQPFKLWKEEFINARNKYFEEMGTLFDELKMEKTFYVFELASDSEEVKEYLNPFQTELNLNAGEPFIGILNIPWVENEGHPGNLNLLSEQVKMPATRAGYQIANGIILGGPIWKSLKKLLGKITVILFET